MIVQSIVCGFIGAVVFHLTYRLLNRLWPPRRSHVPEALRTTSMAGGPVRTRFDVERMEIRAFGRREPVMILGGAEGDLVDLVTGGSGTPEDPFVVHDPSVVESRGPAFWSFNTDVDADRHVVGPEQSHRETAQVVTFGAEGPEVCWRCMLRDAVAVIGLCGVCLEQVRAGEEVRIEGYDGERMVTAHRQIVEQQVGRVIEATPRCGCQDCSDTAVFMGSDSP